MAIITETSDILGYYDDSQARSSGPITAKSLREILDAFEAPLRRWPVRNREERWPIDSQKRAIIHERDGGICRLCGTGGHKLTVDHIIPRSTFGEWEIDIADRSDNLISACWSCNQRKSNYEHPQPKRMGVTVRCWDCRHPEYNLEDYDECPDENPRPDMKVTAFCGGCGITQVPSVEGWIL